MTREVAESHPLCRMFRGLAEHTFMAELGIADPKLVGYVAGLLVRFVPETEVWRLRDGQGRRISEVAAMVAAAESAPDDEHKRDRHRHVGDYTLFWLGVYPEAVDRLKGAGSIDGLIDYRAQGKRSYYVASTLARGGDDDEAPVLRKLSDEFDLCTFGLSRVRREWERGDHGPGGPILAA
jgi:hypothetical protein